MSRPHRLLELTIISAQDLPPVSKWLRTFVVAWVNPDNKLTTKVDQRGHNNPTWNYKLVFRVDDNFLQNEASAINLEVYNVAWLRDLPIGTTRLVMGHISPPLWHHKPNQRLVPLHIRRPSGHLQGTLNVGVKLQGDGNIPPVADKSTPTTISKQPQMFLQDQEEQRYNLSKKQPQIYLYDQVQEQEEQRYNLSKEEKKNHENDSVIIKMRTPDEGVSPLPESIIWSMSESDKKSKPAGSPNKIVSVSANVSPQMLRSKSSRIRTPEEGISSLPESITWSQSELDEKTKPISSTNSLFSAMKPLPSEVVSDMHKGYYCTPAGDGIGSSIFNDWTVPAGSEHNLKSLSVRRKELDDQIDLLAKESEQKHHKGRKRRTSDGKGCMSCFGNAYGFEFTFFCGSKKNKKSRKKKHDGRTNFHSSHAEENLRTFYI